jgi:hypothetical protein
VTQLWIESEIFDESSSRHFSMQLLPIPALASPPDDGVVVVGATVGDGTVIVGVADAMGFDDADVVALADPDPALSAEPPPCDVGSDEPLHATRYPVSARMKP